MAKREDMETSHVQKAGLALVTFEKVLEKLWEDDLVLDSLSVRLPRTEGDEYMVIVRLTHVDERLVAFRSGDTLAEVFTGLVRAIKYKNLKMRKDQYADKND